MSTVNGIKIGANFFRDLAKKDGKGLATIPLKDKSSVNILTGHRTFECYHVKDGSIEGLAGFKTNSTENFYKEARLKLDKIQKFAEDGVNVVNEWISSLAKKG
jgi:hypothetical protein